MIYVLTFYLLIFYYAACYLLKIVYTQSRVYGSASYCHFYLGLSYQILALLETPHK